MEMIDVLKKLRQIAENNGSEDVARAIQSTEKMAPPTISTNPSTPTINENQVDADRVIRELSDVIDGILNTLEDPDDAIDGAARAYEYAHEAKRIVNIYLSGQR